MGRVDDSDGALEAAFKAEHPEVDWSTHEVLWRWTGKDSPMVPDSYWSFQERDEVYRQLVGLNVPVRWVEEHQAWELIREPTTPPTTS